MPLPYKTKCPTCHITETFISGGYGLVADWNHIPQSVMRFQCPICGHISLIQDAHLPIKPQKSKQTTLM